MENTLRIEAVISEFESQESYWRNECDSDSETQRDYARAQLNEIHGKLKKLRDALEIIEESV